MTERDMLSARPRQLRLARGSLAGLLIGLLAASGLLAAPAVGAAHRPASKPGRHGKCANPARRETAKQRARRRRACRPTVTFTVAGQPSEAPPADGAHGAQAALPQWVPSGTGFPSEGREGGDTEEEPGSGSPGAGDEPEPAGPVEAGGPGGPAEAEEQAEEGTESEKPAEAGAEAEEPAETETPEAGGGEEPGPVAEPGPAESPRLPEFFSPTSFWNAELAPDAPLDLSSGPMMQAFTAEVDAELAAERGPSINTGKWSVPLYVVPPDQPTSRVAVTRGGYPALESAWSQVPLPDGVQAAAGTDKHLVVYQPSTDKLWEFWRFEGEPGNWRAGWGGAMEHVSTSSGVYSSAAWPGATSGWGGSATSLPLAGGLVTLEDLERGEIDHALALAIPNVRGDFFSLPARRGDGFSTDPLALPEGARLRLDPNLDLSSLHLPWFTRLLAEAAQRYGIVVRSKASVIDFYGQDPTPTGTNPYGGPNGYFGGMNRLALMAAFPWHSLQLLEMQPRYYR